MKTFWVKLVSVFKKEKRFTVTFQNRTEITVDEVSAVMLTKSLEANEVEFQHIWETDGTFELTVKLSEIISIQKN